MTSINRRNRLQIIFWFSISVFQRINCFYFISLKLATFLCSFRFFIQSTHTNQHFASSSLSSFLIKIPHFPLGFSAIRRLNYNLCTMVHERENVIKRPDKSHCSKTPNCCENKFQHIINNGCKQNKRIALCQQNTRANSIYKSDEKREEKEREYEREFTERKKRRWKGKTEVVNELHNYRNNVHK